MEQLSTIDLDAQEFGVLLRTGWRLGLLVARNVSRGNDRASQTRNKISALRFAEKAGTSADRVLRHLDAWELAAEAGYVPHAADITPGQEIEIGDDMPDWDEFYPPKRTIPAEDDRWAKAEQLAREGMSFRKIGPAVGIDESVIRRDMRVRKARAEADPDFEVETPTSIRHHERTIACELEPAPDVIHDIDMLLQRLLRMYTLSTKDAHTLKKVLANALDQLK